MSQVKYEESPKKEWDKRTINLEAHKFNIPIFHKDIKKYLPVSKKMSCIELGALPGGFLAYFNATFGYSITGLDFAKNIEIFDETMKKNNIKEYRFIKKNILEYSSKTTYDVVTSFGFIEHFEDVEDILCRHERLMSDDGYLVITVPNFRNIQYIYHFLFDRKNLAIHNIATMKTSSMEKLFNSIGLERLEVKYIGKAEFWYEDKWSSSLFILIRNKTTHILNKLFMSAKPSFLYSPLIIYIYKKPNNL